MESLRWILLIAGVIFVLVIYFLGRNRRRKNNSFGDDQYDDLPEFSAKNIDDDFDDVIDDVRIMNGKVDADDEEYSAAQSAFERTAMDYSDGTAMDNSDDSSVHSGIDSSDAHSEPTNSESQTSSRSSAGSSAKSSDKSSTIIVLYILAKPNQELLGSHVNSSVQAMGLSFGDMNIFHYKPGQRKIFSLANMLEPGSFDADTIHDMKTSGLTLFMQISGDDPLDDLTEMLQRSYQLAGLLDAVLCNSKRKPLTEQDAENYRAQVRTFIKG